MSTEGKLSSFILKFPGYNSMTFSGAISSAKVRKNWSPLKMKIEIKHIESFLRAKRVIMSFLLEFEFV